MWSACSSWRNPVQGMTRGTYSYHYTANLLSTMLQIPLMICHLHPLHETRLPSSSVPWSLLPSPWPLEFIYVCAGPLGYKLDCRGLVVIAVDEASFRIQDTAGLIFLRLMSSSGFEWGGKKRKKARQDLYHYVLRCRRPDHYKSIIFKK